jgi:D-threo-aldose 1-dehydrogenase
MGLGTATFGGLYTSMSQEQCDAAINCALESGITYIDTAPHYGKGVAERRLAHSLKGRARSSFEISSKIGRLLVPEEKEIDPDFLDTDTTLTRIFDFSEGGVEKSFRSSLERMELESIDILFIHDPDNNADAAIRESFPALLKMRDKGIINAIGVGMNQSATPARLIKETDIDVVLIAGRYSLLDQRALADLLPAALERGVDIIAAGVLNSGILANPVKGATFDYAPASDEILAKAQRIKAVLDKEDIPLTAAALQFPLCHPAVKCVLIGCRSTDEILNNAQNLDMALPEGIWQKIAAVL